MLGSQSFVLRPWHHGKSLPDWIYKSGRTSFSLALEVNFQLVLRVIPQLALRVNFQLALRVNSQLALRVIP